MNYKLIIVVFLASIYFAFPSYTFAQTITSDSTQIKTDTINTVDSDANETKEVEGSESARDANLNGYESTESRKAEKERIKQAREDAKAQKAEAREAKQVEKEAKRAARKNRKMARTERKANKAERKAEKARKKAEKQNEKLEDDTN